MTSLQRLEAFQEAVEAAAKLQKNLTTEKGRAGSESPKSGSFKHALMKVWDGNPTSSPASYEKDGKADDVVIRFAEWLLDGDDDDVA